MKFIKDMQHRSLSPEHVEGWRGRRRVRPNSEPNAEECDTTDDDQRTERWQTNKKNIQKINTYYGRQ
jgi:hypothetical protein